MLMPQIIGEKCNGCWLCVSVCWNRCLVLVDGVVAIVEGVECNWCTDCEAVCASGAISCPYEIVLE